MPLFSLFLALEALTNTAAARAESVAAAQAFVEGCEQGSLRLSPSRGRFLSDKEVPPIADLKWGYMQEKRTVIKFNYPRSTYMIIFDLSDPQPKSFVKACILVSRAIREPEAEYAFLQGAPKGKKPEQYWWPHMYFREWSFDLPKLGYRKRLKYFDDKSVLLEVATYKSAAN